MEPETSSYACSNTAKANRVTSGAILSNSADGEEAAISTKKTPGNHKSSGVLCRAGDGIRTRDVQLGKLALYH